MVSCFFYLCYESLRAFSARFPCSVCAPLLSVLRRCRIHADDGVDLYDIVLRNTIAAMLACRLFEVTQTFAHGPDALVLSELMKHVAGTPLRIAKTLRTLERDGYVSRKVYPTIPPKVEYSLTPLGKSLAAQMKLLYGLK